MIWSTRNLCIWTLIDVSILLAHLSHWLMVTYCDHWMSVVCRQSCVLNNCFKGHLLNYQLDFDQTW